MTAGETGVTTFCKASEKACSNMAKASGESRAELLKTLEEVDNAVRNVAQALGTKHPSLITSANKLRQLANSTVSTEKQLHVTTILEAWKRMNTETFQFEKLEAFLALLNRDGLETTEIEDNTVTNLQQVVEQMCLRAAELKQLKPATDADKECMEQHKKNMSKIQQLVPGARALSTVLGPARGNSMMRQRLLQAIDPVL
eukprot:84357-Amphidinium_carterae.1